MNEKTDTESTSKTENQLKDEAAMLSENPAPPMAVQPQVLEAPKPPAVSPSAKIITVDDSPNQLILDTGKFEQAQRVAVLMASSQLVPKHLQGRPADCFLVINQAIKWGCDPFSVAQSTFLVSGKLGYEGKLVAAVINTHPALQSRLNYKYSGEGKERAVTVIAQLKGESEPREVTVIFKDVETNNAHWGKSPDQMLAYRGAREWARRHTPDVMMGILTEDELQGSAAPTPIADTKEKESTAQIKSRLDAFEGKTE